LYIQRTVLLIDLVPPRLYFGRVHISSRTAQSLLPLLLGTANFFRWEEHLGIGPSERKLGAPSPKDPPPPAALLRAPIQAAPTIPEAQDNAYIAGAVAHSTSEATIYQGSKAFPFSLPSSCASARAFSDPRFLRFR
jgi:hypothetical protein